MPESNSNVKVNFIFHSNNISDFIILDSAHWLQSGHCSMVNGASLDCSQHGPGIRPAPSGFTRPERAFSIRAWQRARLL